MPSRLPSTQSTRAEEVGGGEAVLRVPHAPVAVIQALEVAPVARRAAEVDREPRVPLVDEVLRMAVPLVAVVARGAAVRVDDRGHRGLRRGSGRPEEEGRDLDPVERRVGDVLGAHVRGGADSARRRGVERDGDPTLAHEPDLRRGGGVLVGGEDRAVRCPVGCAPGSALGDDRHVPGSRQRR